MKKKEKVLILISHYLPGERSGGPIHSLSNLVQALGDEIDFKIITSDRDLGDEEAYPGVPSNKWIRIGKAEVIYLPSRGILFFIHMLRLLRTTQYDILYLNSFFARRFSIFPTVLYWMKMIPQVPVLLAPKGEFSAGAMKIRARRKRFFLRFSDYLGLYKSVTWHASSAYEKEDIARMFPILIRSEPAFPDLIAANHHTGGTCGRQGQVIVAMDLSTVSELDSQKENNYRKIPGKLNVVFLSRISRKKNLDGALMMMNGLSGIVHFDIYGPIEDDEYWEECRTLIDRMPPNICVEYKGAIRHDLVGDIFACHELFFFPTHGENFGHVIIESLRSGCPVLISDQTPWRRLMEKGVGWDIPLGEPERFQGALQKCIDMGLEDFRAFSERVYAYGNKMSNNTEIIDQNRQLFLNCKEVFASSQR